MAVAVGVGMGVGVGVGGRALLVMRTSRRSLTRRYRQLYCSLPVSSSS